MANSSLPADPASLAVGQRIPLWKLGGLGPARVLIRSVRGYWRNQLDVRSAQFAFNALLAMPPLLILMIACIARLPLSGLTDSMLETASRALPEEAYELFEQQIRDVQANSSGQLVLASLVVLALAGSRLFLSLGAGLNAAYEITGPRRFWRQRGLALSLTVGVFLLLLTALVLLVAGPSIMHLALDRFDVPILGRVMLAALRWTVLCGVLLLSTAVMYSWVPAGNLPWYWLSPGGVFATVGWIVASGGFRLYVENFGRYNQTYGALGAVIVLLLWLYLAGAVLLLGGQINSVIRGATLENRPS